MSRHGAMDAGKGGRSTVDRLRWQRRRTWPAVMMLEDRRMLSTFTVTSAADSAPAASPAVNTLRWAVEQANEATSASSIEIELGTSPATITLAQGPLTLFNTAYATTIYDGPGEGPVTISGNNASQVIQVEAKVTGSISGLTISDGSTLGSGGGLYNDGGTVMLTDCTVSGNSASENGGGLYTRGYGSTTMLTDCKVSGNVTSGNGGGLYTGGYGTTSLTYCTVSGNSASGNGGGLYTGGYGTTSLTYCTVSGNSASGNGGGVASSNGTTTMTGCTISGNSASGSGGGMLNFFSTIALSDCTISGNSASGNGGGLYDFLGKLILNDGKFTGNYAENGGGLFDFFGSGTLANCRFSGNSATQSGGGFYSHGSYLTLSYGCFSANSAAESGGGLYSNGSYLTLSHEAFSGNSAAVNGGGLYDNGSTIALDYGTFSSNFAGNNGGGADNVKATTSLIGVTVSGNSAGHGGGLANFGGTTGLTDCAVSGNSGAYGGGLYNVDGTTALTDVSVSGNFASNGGGLCNQNGTTTLNNSAVSGNTAINGGGGVFNDLGTTTLVNCSVSDNDASSGGGVSNDSDGTTTLTNCTVSGNSASANGGGVDSESDSTTVLTNCTLSGNSAGVEGGGIDNESSVVSIGNTIVAANTGTDAGPDAVGIFASLGNNLIEVINGSSGWVDADLTGTEANPLDALLAPLGNYGGSTQTMALLPGSPAINAGNNALIPAGVTTDQRGLPRIVNGIVDIGAFESSGFTIAVTSGSDQSTDVLTPFSAPLVATVTANNPREPVVGGLVTFTSPQDGPSAALTGNPATISSNGTVSVTATANAIGGSYAVSATANGIANSASFSLTNKWVPIFSVASQTIVYGTATTTLSGELGDGTAYPTGSTVEITLDSVTQTTTVDSSGNFTTTFNTATLGVAAGPYTVSYAFAGNSAFASAADASTQVTVTPAPLTITAGGVSRVYGASDPALGVTYSGFVNNETSSVLGGTLSVVDSDAATTTAVGNYAGVITASGLISTNYAISYVAGSLTVTPAPLTVAAGGVSRVYGASDPALGVTYSGFVNDETSSVLGGTLSVVDTDAAPTTGVGSYAGVITAAGLTSTNYTITYVAGNLTVTPAPLTVTASGVSRVYGASDPALGVTYSGFVNDETSSVLGGTLSVVDSDAAPTTGVGSYAGVITASGLTSTNYTITYVAGNLTVTPAPLTITAGGVSRVYGASDPALGVTYSGFMNDETFSVLGGTLSVVDADASPTTGVGSYAGVITASGLSSTNYTITYVAGNLTVTPAPLTISAGGVSRVYGASDSALGVTYSGFVNDETSSVLGGALSVVDADAAPTTGVGSYAGVITAAGLTSTNYTITYVAGSLTVTPAPLTITAGGVSRVYGASDPAPGVTYSGFVNDETSSVLGGTLSVVDSDAVPTTAVGNYAGVITASGLTSTNYAITYVACNLTVTPAPLTITASGVSLVYGASDPAPGVTYSGFVNDETSSVLSGTLSVVDADAAPTTGVGSYAGVITASGLTSTNYTITYVAGNLTVTPAPLTITACNITKTYGQTVTFGSTAFTTSGLLNSDSVSSVSLSSTGESAAATVSGSPYAVVASGAIGSGLENYTISYVNGSLTVNPAPLTVTANNMTKTYGQTVTLTTAAFSTSGLLNGDSVSSVSLSSTGASATATVNGSPYAIDASGAVGSGLGNYTISYVNGSLTVNPAPLTITANNITKTYGQTVTLTTAAFSTSGLLNSDSVSNVSLSSTGAAATATVSGSPYAIVASGAVGSGLGNYTITYGNGSLTVSPAPLTITANNIAKTYGQAVTLTSTAFSTSGLFNSDSVSGVSLSSTGASATATVNGSPYAIVASGAVGSGLGNYTISYVNGSLTVNPAPLTITAKNTTKTYGQTATFAGTAFSTSGLLNSDSVSSVSLSSTGAAATATVNGSPYAIVASSPVGSGLGNYTISYVNGSLTVNPAPLTITANSMTKTYGQTVTFAGTAFSTSGLLNSDSVSSVSLSSTGAAATATVNGSPYAIVASGAVGSGLGNYTIDYANGSLTVTPAVTAIATTPSATTLALSASSVTLNDTAVLSGGYNETGTITFTLYLGSTLEKTQTVSVSGNGTYTTPTGYTLPTTGTVTGTYQWDSSYSGDSNDLAASETGASNEQVKVSPASPSITTTPNTTSGMCGTSETLKDTATIAGAYDPTGTITFTLYSPNDTPLDTETVTINGDGTYSAPRGYSLPSNPAPGTYQWDASYGGDKNNNAATDDNDNAEKVVVGLANPTITTRPSTTSATCGTSVTLMDTATLSGGDDPTGSITFTLYSPSDTLLDTEAVTVNGDGTYTTPKGYALPSNAAAGTYQWDASYGGNGDNNPATDDNDTAEQVVVSSGVCPGQTAPLSYWCGSQGQSLIKCLNGGSSCTNLGSWLANTCPNLFGSLSRCSNSQVASYCNSLNNGNANQQACGQVLATAISCYVTNSNLAGSAAQSCGFNVTSNGTGSCTYNVGTNGSGLGVSNNTSCSVLGLLQQIDKQSCGGSINSPAVNPATSICGSINRAGGSHNATLSDSGLAYSPAQIRDAYGINALGAGLTNVPLDGTGQTIAIVEAYDDPDIFQAVDDYDTEFSLTDSGPSLYSQYGPASSFLTVVNQNGQTAPLPETDPSGPGTENWELEESLDVEWAHAIAPGAQIVVVEANSQSLSDLMASVATAASQPGVSVVSMSWGLPEGQAVFASDEATYDSVFNVPGVTFVASTGDYGAADPEYPAFSPNVVAVGGTSLTLNGDNSYNSETGWGYQSDSAGAFIGSGGGISLYEPEPAYQQGVQSTGSRTIPDVSFDADPATGAWVADPYNLSADNPFEVVGGTSLSAPSWAGLVALVNEGRAISGEPTLDSTGPTEAQQALYSLPQSDYNVISSGFNGYTANAGYNLVTGLGTPVANLLVGDLVDYQGPGTVYSGPTVGALQDATLVSTGSSGGGTSNVFSVFSAATMSNSGFGYAQGPGVASMTGTTMNGMPAQNGVASHSTLTPLTSLWSTVAMTPSSSPQSATLGSNGWATALTPVAPASHSPGGAPVHARFDSHEVTGSAGQAVASVSANSRDLGGPAATDRAVLDQVLPSWRQTGAVADAVLDELAADPVMWPSEHANATVAIPALATEWGLGGRVIGDPLINKSDRSLPPADYAAGLAFLGLAAGFWARGADLVDAKKRRRGLPLSMRKPI